MGSSGRSRRKDRHRGRREEEIAILMVGATKKLHFSSLTRRITPQHSRALVSRKIPSATSERALSRSRNKPTFLRPNISAVPGVPRLFSSWMTGGCWTTSRSTTWRRGSPRSLPKALPTDGTTGI